MPQVPVIRYSTASFGAPGSSHSEIRHDICPRELAGSPKQSFVTSAFEP
jgi:hypothetical protein